MTPDRSVPHRTLRPRRVAAALAAAVLTTASLGGTAPAAQAQQLPPFAACDPAGYLFQVDQDTDYTQALRVDLLTGAYAEVDTIPGRSVNSIGYNVLDDYVYGWDTFAFEIVRVGSDFEVESLGRPAYDHDGDPATPAEPLPNNVVGDIDPDGFYWVLAGPTYFQIDLRPASPTYAQVLSHGPAAMPTGYDRGADWAFVAGTGHLWMVGSATAENPPPESALLGFDLDTRQFGAAVRLPAVTDIGGFGAVYADANGFLYASANVSGNIWRIEVEDPDNHSHFADGPSATGNDGVRCGLAPMPIDFGDAPDGYATTLDADGARHGLDPELVLGTELDVEVDGQPGDAADGDDTTGVADEDALTDPEQIEETADTVALTVPVTNQTTDDATVAGWIDFDGDATFEAGERATAVAAGTGSARLTWSLPEDVAGGETYLRLRLFPGTVADPAPAGSAAAGEVEDHRITITEPPDPVAAYRVAKSADPADQATVSAGDKIAYTLTVSNTGAVDLTGADAPTVTDDLSGVLDDATHNGDATASAGSVDVTGNTLTWTGDLAVDAVVTVTYSVTVGGDGERGDDRLRNVVAGTGPTNCAAGSTDAGCAVQHTAVDRQPPGGQLPDTGADVLALAGYGALLLLAGTAVYLLARRRRIDQ